MNKSVLVLIAILYLLLQSCNTKETELVLLGTVHQPIENFTSDSLYNILLKIKPDLILYEADSSFFTEAFQFNKTWGSNENIATLKYMENFDVDVRPYDFTGRNEYRINIGSRPTDGKASNLLDSLYGEGALSLNEKNIYEKFLEVNDSLNAFAIMGAKAFNTTKTDSIAALRQDYQYNKLLGIMVNNPIFADTFHVKKDGVGISYVNGYKLAGDFWHLRNKTMAKNILHFVNEFKGKRIVVLNGYFHRYYLNLLLRPEQEKNNFVIKNFYEY